MRYATACVVCSGSFEKKKGRSDRRYCDVRCRVRACRLRAKGSRRQVSAAHSDVRDAQEAATSLEPRLQEAKEWAALLEEETEKQRREIERLQWALMEAEERNAQSKAEQTRRLVEAEAAAQAAQEQATQQTAACAEAEALLITVQQEARTHRAAAVKHTHRSKAKEEEIAQLEALGKKQRKEIADLRADDVQIGKDRFELRQTRQKLEEASTLIRTLRASEEQNANAHAELRQTQQKLEEASTLIRELRVSEEQSAKAHAELRQVRQKLESANKEILALRAEDVRIGRERAELRQIRQDYKALCIRLERMQTTLLEYGEIVDERTRERDHATRTRDAMERQRDAMERERDVAERERDAMAKNLADAEAALDRWKRGLHFQIFKGAVEGLKELRRGYEDDVKKRLPEPDDPADD